MVKLSNALTGACGLYYAAAELTRLGYTTALTTRNAKGIDILASTCDGKRSVQIQVKTSNCNPRYKFILNKDAETLYAKDLFYIFVHLNGLSTTPYKPATKPDYYIVPSKIVANHVRTSHEEWLMKLGRNGQTHKDTPMRTFIDHNDEYREKWELLEQ
ncbi:MAG: hypothetical protein QQM50_01145 [Dehalococcoides mccartyi]|uniref:hypothetical protein n=1 Tax=Dehalococcoides TaxID=61434 RepID=UPI002737EF6A|nr:hypothetical protein [Dehalococcoides mccartyi]MDP4279143.1 hypothetical protein [Dehalococcoides mccartyi]